MSMRVADFDFDLPAELVAQEARPRGESRLLVLDRQSGTITHATVADLPSLLRRGDLSGRQRHSGVCRPAVGVSRAERWSGRMPARRPSRGESAGRDMDRAHASWPEAQAGRPRTVRRAGRRPDGRGDRARHFQGRRTIRLRSEAGGDVTTLIDALGHVPLPPYIKRADTPDDRERYQTVFARARGSIAAPTAGLHFTHRAARGACALAASSSTAITLHVGYGTFKPVKVDRVEDHVVDPERYAIGDEPRRAINRGARRRPPRDRRRHDDHQSARARRAPQAPATCAPARARPISSSILVSSFRWSAA